MTYVVCQTPDCQQTYPIDQFKTDAKDVSCEKCGGVLIDRDGKANFSQNPDVIKVMPPEEPAGQPEGKEPETYHMYACENGCGHTTVIDKFYKTRRVHCGVCGTKTTMVYRGECAVSLLPKKSAFSVTAPDDGRSCFNCRFYDAGQALCEYNYRAKCVLDEDETAAKCPLYQLGIFVDSDENLLVKE